MFYVLNLIRKTRLLLLVRIGVYPLLYLVPTFTSTFPRSAPTTFVTVQLGYTVVDITAKSGYGVLIYNAAR